MNIHVDTLFAWGGVIYRPGQACAPDDAAKWAIERGYARHSPSPADSPLGEGASKSPENKAHAAAPKRTVRKKSSELASGELRVETTPNS